MSKPKIAVVMGGKSAEYDVSLNSGRNIAYFFDKNKYDIYPLIITKDGLWHFSKTIVDPDLSLDDLLLTWDDIQKSKGLVAEEALLEIRKMKIDLMFLSLHGPFGEDGCLQGLFEIMELPYTGSDVMSSALGMDKIRFKKMLSAYGLPVPKDRTITDKEWEADKSGLSDEIEKEFGIPVVMKSPRLGSSIGLGIAFSREEIVQILNKIFTYDKIVMVEQYIKGREITCGVLGDKEKLNALPLIEIKPKEAEYFDYKAKYIAGATEEVCPADVPDKIRQRAQDFAKQVHSITGCGDLSRTDMIFIDDEIFILETNTIPGMTKTSLIPQSALKFGLDFPALTDHIAQNALWRYKNKKTNLEM